MNTEAAKLDAMLADIARAVEDARAFQHEHGFGSGRTRKLPGDMLRILRRWRSENGVTRASVPEFSPQTRQAAPRLDDQTRA